MQTAAYEALLSYYGSGSTETENDYVLTVLGENATNGIDTDVNKGTLTYNGQTYKISEILGKSNEQKALANNGVTESTGEASSTIATLLEDENVRMVVVAEDEEDDANATYAVIPVGFYYVTGTPAEGLVISDVNGDDDANSKGGNQFVWVPCNGDDGVTYEKTDDTDGSSHGLASTWTTNYKGYQYFYTTVPDYTDSSTGDVTEGWTLTDCWSDEGGSYTSVSKYGGFYIGRYEAGLPENSSLWGSTDGSTYGWTNGAAAGSTSGTRNTTTFNDEDLIPVSKKNNASWNRISQTNAVTVSAKMYTDTSTYAVTSSLVDSYAWDTIVEWMVSSGGITRTENSSTASSKYSMNSTSYGNYINSTFSLEDVLYAEHTYSWVTGDSGWKTYASKYKRGNLEITSRSTTGTQTVYELATGTTEETKVNNIYDMAGNMWEWTTETGTHVTNALASGSGTYAVFRGGSFSRNGSSYPVSRREGGGSTPGTNVGIGFRVVLYIT